jgi:hypothetical protein
MMAKSLLSVKTKKVQRKTHSETYLVNRKYLGEEPIKIVTSVDMMRAFTWYHNMCDASDAKQYMKDYFVSDKSMTKTIARIADSRIPYTAAWMCRIASNQKRELTDAERAKVSNDIADAAGAYEEPTEKVSEAAAKPSIQDRIKDRSHNIVGEIESLIDSGETFSLYDWLQKNEIPAMYASKIAEFYRSIEDEFVQAYAGKIDGYETWSKPKLKERATFYGKIVSDAERYGDVAKKVRKPRKTKAPSSAKILQFFKYQKESKDHKIASINPESILGAQELWVFNSKYKILSVFMAKDRAGFGVNRQAITNYDEKTSKSMRIGRKTDEQIKKVTAGGKIILRKLAAEMDLPITARLNEATVLLKAVKG